MYNRGFGGRVNQEMLNRLEEQRDNPQQTNRGPNYADLYHGGVDHNSLPANPSDRNARLLNQFSGVFGVQGPPQHYDQLAPPGPDTQHLGPSMRGHGAFGAGNLEPPRFGYTFDPGRQTFVDPNTGHVYRHELGGFVDPANPGGPVDPPNASMWDMTAQQERADRYSQRNAPPRSTPEQFLRTPVDTSSAYATRRELPRVENLEHFPAIRALVDKHKAGIWIMSPYVLDITNTINLGVLRQDDRRTALAIKGELINLSNTTRDLSHLEAGILRGDQNTNDVYAAHDSINTSLINLRLYASRSPERLKTITNNFLHEIGATEHTPRDDHETSQPLAPQEQPLQQPAEELPIVQHAPHSGGSGPSWEAQHQQILEQHKQIMENHEAQMKQLALDRARWERERAAWRREQELDQLLLGEISIESLEQHPQQPEEELPIVQHAPHSAGSGQSWEAQHKQMVDTHEAQMKQLALDRARWREQDRIHEESERQKKNRRALEADKQRREELRDPRYNFGH